MSARRQRSIPGLLTEPLPASKRSSTQAPHGRTPPIEPINKNHVSKKTLTIIGAAAGAAALTPGAVSLASAEDQPAPVAADSSQSAPQGPGTGETPLNGIEAEQFTVAALEAVADTTIIRVETDSEGVLEAHVQEADGAEVVVAVDFNVTGIREMQGHGGRGGHGGPERDSAHGRGRGEGDRLRTGRVPGRHRVARRDRRRRHLRGTRAQSRRHRGRDRLHADFAITEVHAMHGRGGHDHGASDTGQSPDSA